MAGFSLEGFKPGKSGPALFFRVHPAKFTAVVYRGNSGGYGNLAVYRLIWL